MRKFEAPELEIVKFEIADVITTSNEWNGDDGDNNTGWN